MFKLFRKLREHAVKEEMQNAAALRASYQIRVTVPSLGKRGLLDMSYTYSNPPVLCVNAARSSHEIFQPRYTGYNSRGYIQFEEGKNFLENILTEEVIKVLEENVKYEEIRRNLRKK